MNITFLSKLSQELSAFESDANPYWKPDMSFEEVEQRMDERKEMIEQAEKHGLSQVGEGGFRTVFEAQPNNDFDLPSDTVVKISRFYGDQQNDMVIGIYQDLSDQEKECVAKILDYDEDGKWILQEKASSARPGDTDKVRKKLAEHDRYVGDIRKNNCGRIDGEPVLIDLGLLQ